MTRRAGHSPLRQLALDYAEGRSERADYLRARHRFLDTLNAAPPRPGAAPSCADRNPAPPPGDEVQPLSRPAPVPVPARARRPARMLLLGAGLALPLAAVIWYALHSGDSAEAPPAVDPAAAAPPDAPRVPAPAAPSPPEPPVQESVTAGSAPTALSLIEEWRREGQWGAAERARFLDAWHRQTPAAQALARKDYAFRSLEEELRNLIDAERAAGDSEAAQGLPAFARALGIDLPDLPPAPAPLPIGTRPSVAAATSIPTTDDLPAPGAPTDRTTPPDDRSPHRIAGRQGEEPRTPSTVPPSTDSSAPDTVGAAPAADASPGIAKTSKDAVKVPPAPAAVPTKAPLPSLMERLPVRPGGEPCAGLAGRTHGSVYDCRDPFISNRAAGLKLKVIPAATPFAITAEPHNVDQWCAQKPSPCPPSADAGAKARDYCDHVGKKTGQTYRPATPADLQQAAAYGMNLPQDGRSGLRLIRELGQPQSKDEATMLDRWWHQYHRPTP